MSVIRVALGNPTVDELLGYLKQHYEAFRSMPLFRNTTFLYVVENNMGNEHQWIARFVAETDTMANVYVLQERTGQVGFRTDEAAKLRRPRLLYDILQIDGMAIVKDVVSVNADKKRCGENAVDVFLLQMKRMQEFTRMTPNKVHTIISAIFNEEGKRIVENNDDVVQANIVMNEAMKLFLSKKLPTDQYTRINHIREHERGKRHKRQKMLPEGYGRALSVYGGDNFLNQ